VLSPAGRVDSRQDALLHESFAEEDGSLCLPHGDAGDDDVQSEDVDI